MSERASFRNGYAGPRRGLRRDEAAAYVGVSATKFDQLVAEGRMPQPGHVDSCAIWDLRALDVAFDALMDNVIAGAENPWRNRHRGSAA